MVKINSRNAIQQALLIWVAYCVAVALLYLFFLWIKDFIFFSTNQWGVISLTIIRALAIIAIFKVKLLSLSELSFRKISAFKYLIFVFIGLLQVGLAYLISVVGEQYLSLDMGKAEFTSVLATISALVIAPFFEEIFYRGVIQKRLHEALNIHVSILIASIMFAIDHINSGSGIIYILMLSIIQGYLYIKTRSLPLAIISHGSYNLAIYLILIMS